MDLAYWTRCWVITSWK